MSCDTIAATAATSDEMITAAGPTVKVTEHLETAAALLTENVVGLGPCFLKSLSG